ncbi:discoidin domain-containing protein [Sphaerisporangium sp. NBC_01403]|uniref:discoidin domain-containing protein n=1 Tax=Sphaerisporangium sp. NBC_01403 TaxID=2903599 RepID=UPI003254FD39
MASLRAGPSPKDRDTMHTYRLTAALAAAALAAASAVLAFPATNAAALQAAAQVPDLTSANRRAPIAGLPDWSKAGYRGGAALPGSADINPDATCQITPAELASTYGVKPGDGADDSAGLQQAIDFVRTTCSPSAGYTKLSLITLPAGRLDVTRQLGLDADYLLIKGAGADQTTLVFRPGLDTRYDALTPDGGDWDEDGMTSGAGKGGWIWPGRGLFRVQTREVSAKYASDYAAAPANRKDLFEGSVNQHWAGGVALRQASAAGSKVISLASNATMTPFKAGGYLWVGAANSAKFYQQQTITDSSQYLNMHMRQQIFQITAVDTANRTVTIDKPLEWDLPVDSTSDGSAAIGGTVYPSRVTPLKVVQGVGIEDLGITQDMAGLPKLVGGTYALNEADAVHNYGNMAPEYEMHGIVLKWAVNSWIRHVNTHMTGSHPIVTENAKNVQVQESSLDGAWNKGKGGNGYFQGSRVWDSLYAYNTTRNLRHFTFQWSASDNVALGNDFDSDLNLHGGWEHRNLFEGNTVSVPFEHASKNCRSNCGEEGDTGTGVPDNSTWYPIWWAAGPKAVKWSGSSGPQNVFYGNAMRKQLTAGGTYTDYYADRQRIYQFGSGSTDASAFQHLAIGGTTIPDWASRETADYSTAPDAGVNASKTDTTGSLFLKSATTTPTPTPTVTPTVTPTPTPTVTPPGGGNLACGKTVTASSNTSTAARAADCDPATAWQSTTAKPATLSVDLGTAQRITKIAVKWGSGYGTSYKFRKSSDGSGWSTFQDGTGLDGGTDEVAVDVTTRYLQLYLSQYAGSSGFTVNELELYGPGGGPSATPTPTVTPTPTPTVTPPAGGRTVNVATPAQLKAAIADAQPGDTIKLADGVYHDEFVITASGTSSKRITLAGSRNAIIENDLPGAGSGCPNGHLQYGLYLNGASFWNLTGFTVRDSKKGVVMDGAKSTVIDGLYVHHTQDEGVHFRKGSSDGVIKNSTVTDTGLVQPGYGEGVYLGSANSNWSCFGGSDGIDRTNNVQVLNNTIGPNVAAEAIDIKEGTSGGVIKGNHFDGTGEQNVNSGDSWLDVKGDGYTIESNTGVNPYTEGVRVQTVYSPYGCGNVFRSNDFTIGGAPGYAIFVNNQSSCAAKNVVYASNTSTGGKGLTNIPVTP